MTLALVAISISDSTAASETRRRRTARPLHPPRNAIHDPYHGEGLNERRGEGGVAGEGDSIADTRGTDRYAKSIARSCIGSPAEP